MANSLLLFITHKIENQKRPQYKIIQILTLHRPMPATVAQAIPSLITGRYALAFAEARTSSCRAILSLQGRELL